MTERLLFSAPTTGKVKKQTSVVAKTKAPEKSVYPSHAISIEPMPIFGSMVGISKNVVQLNIN